jgi:hypothetical protein
VSVTIDLQIDTRAMDRALAALPQRLAKRSMRKALQAAGNVMLAPMVALAPERTDEPTPDSDSLPPGVLKADLTTQVGVSSSGGGYVKVGSTPDTGRVAHWQENGFEITKGGWSREDKKTGKRLGPGKVIKRVEGKHFMLGAFDESSTAAVSTFCQVLGDDLFGKGESGDLEGVGAGGEYGGENY